MATARSWRHKVELLLTITQYLRALQNDRQI